ncbi:MAG: XdhC family protein [Caldilineaceae bacterium]|nr:XdhC family protein [Caldilineaceae bacterium]
MTSIYPSLAQAIKADQLIAVATVLTGSNIGQKLLIWPNGQSQGSLGDIHIEEVVKGRAQVAMQRQQPERFRLGEAADSPEIFVDVHLPPPKLVIVGAVHIAISLVDFARALGFRTIVVDARTVFATEDRFRHADELIIGWPADVLAGLNLNEATYVVTLTHDEKLDNPALLVALNHPVRYIGALGSVRTHAARVEALKEAGIRDDQIDRIHTPIGLPLGGRRPEEIAVSIIAEIVCVMNGQKRSGIGY